MKQVELVEAFLEGATSGEAKTLRIEGDRLVHYATPIAERYDGKIILNYTRYSLATGRVQKIITDTADPDTLIKISGVPEGTKLSLSSFLDGNDITKPDEYLMAVEHEDFGKGYVVAVNDDVATVVYSSGEKKLLWSIAMNSGKMTVLEDLR